MLTNPIRMGAVLPVDSPPRRAPQTTSTPFSYHLLAALPSAGRRPLPYRPPRDVPKLSTEGDQSPELDVLKQELQKRGLDPKSVQLEVERGTMYYPGGSYNNDQVKVTFPSGAVSYYSVGLMMRTPHVTALEIAIGLGAA